MSAERNALTADRFVLQISLLQPANVCALNE